MPGTIHVSVLDLMGLPTSSSSVKVSMGKREYQIWDKGDFSFPLTTLRDNLIVTLHDAEGNELSRTGVKTMLVVEKGFWDDLFPLQGGGHLHMKLQFVLSEEEQKRIREMRESALKKKLGELLSGSIREAETAAVATVGSNIASSPSTMSPAFSEDSQESLVQMEAVSVAEESLQDRSISNPISHDKDTQSSPGNREGTSIDRLEQTDPNDTDESEGASSILLPSQELKILHLTEANKKLSEKIETGSPPIDDPMKPISESLVAKNNHLIPNKLDEDQTHSPKKQSALEKTPSNVRKMISAFEGSLSQGLSLHVNTSTTKAQSNKTKIEGSVKGPSVQDARMERRKITHEIAKTELNSFSIEKSMDVNLQQRPKDIRSREDQIDLIAPSVSGATYTMPMSLEIERLKVSRAPDTLPMSLEIGELEVSSARQTTEERTNSNKNVNFELPCQKEYKKNEGTVLEELSGPSVAEIAMVSGRMLDGSVDIDQSCSVSSDQNDSTLVALEKSGWRTSVEVSDKLSICGPSSERQHSIVNPGMEQFPSEISGSLIFSDESRRLCITTGSKQVIDLMGGCRGDIGAPNQGEISLPGIESVNEQNVQRDTCIEVNKNENLESSTDDGDSGGLIRQAIRVAILVAFSTLVLVTRERKTR